MRTIYLCGGIAGLTEEEATGWRQTATKALRDGWDVLDPTRRKYGEATAWETVRGDLDDINRSTVVLVKADRPSWGTAMEVLYAARTGKWVILFGTQMDGLSPWLAVHAHYVYPTLEESLRKLTWDVDLTYGPPRDTTWQP